VLTAHPTEATRRTPAARSRQGRGAARPPDDPDVTPPERADLEDQLAAEITILWQTDEVRHDRPRVGDEIRHGLWFFEESLFDAGERLLRDYRRFAPGAPPPFSFGSWIGGDLDVNPEVGRETILTALERSRESAVGRYRGDIRELAVEFSSSRSLVGVSEELEESIARDERECPGYRDEIVQMMSTESYRKKLSYMWWRLGNDGYASPEELSADLAVIGRSLEANRGGRLADGPLVPRNAA
jgi:phosphoenolpyruvate carboxylase